MGRKLFSLLTFGLVLATGVSARAEFTTTYQTTVDPGTRSIGGIVVFETTTTGGLSSWPYFVNGGSVATLEAVPNLIGLGTTSSFSVTAPSGNYPVLVSLIKEEVALVMVSFAEGPPVRWRKTKPETFGVDSATGCLMDHKVCRFLRRKAAAEKYETYIRRFQDALEENEGLWGNYCLDVESGTNVVLFRTWGGDGVFPSFFGYNATGEVVCLVTDMYLCFEHVLGSAPD